ncbi:hypothetical protein [Streptomyces sp. NPDC005573]|uniref:hypothetical protein n=1 Tax=Streptomyces sp. NPDC005573 TaxID=3156890 RepID=UPI0033A75BA8
MTDYMGNGPGAGSRTGAVKKPEPQQYNGGTYTDGSTGHIDKSSLPPVPAVPVSEKQGKGKTSVDTSSLKKFADNLDMLADMLDDARIRVKGIKDLAAGSFKEAEDLKKAVTGDRPAGGTGDSTSGPTSSGGLRGNYFQALHDLRVVLMQTADNIRHLATKYSTIEDINAKAGSDLTNLINQAEGELQTLQQDPL